MNTPLLIITLLATFVVMMRFICMIAKAGRKKWGGHPLQFIGLSISYPMIAGGALAGVLGWKHSISILIIGVAGLFLSERRTLIKR